MSLQSTAQELIVVDPNSDREMTLVPLEVSEAPMMSTPLGDAMEVNEPVEVEIVIEEIPGAPKGTKDPEPVLEVSEEKDEEEDKSKAEDAVQPLDKWNPKSHPEGFIAWIKGRIDDVPKHSGQDSSGCERALAYLEKLDNEISRAMRLDVDGELDANKVEAVRSQIDEGISRLHDRLDKIKKHVKSKRKKKADFSDSVLVKEAQKITGVSGIVVTVPLLISRIARVCINGSVSAGHALEDILDQQIKKYKLNDREQAEVIQLIQDLGYTIKEDRGYLLDESGDSRSSDNFDFSAQFSS